MIFFATDFVSPVTVVLITGDGDYTYAMAKLIHRRHRVVVVGPSGASTGLRNSAIEFLDWNTEVVGHLHLGSVTDVAPNTSQSIASDSTPGAFAEPEDVTATPHSPSDLSFVSNPAVIPSSKP